MSNFDTYSSAVAGLVGTAPMIYVATTDDNLATITGAGYMNDIQALGQTKVNDLWYINYDVDGTPASQMFTVEFSASNYNLVAFSATEGTLLAANNLSDVAAVATARTNLGLYKNTIAYAGGSATAVLTAAGITSSSVVTAQIAASTNAVTVQKVTPGSGNITVLMSGDPGASTSFNVVGYL